MFMNLNFYMIHIDPLVFIQVADVLDRSASHETLQFVITGLLLGFRGANSDHHALSFVEIPDLSDREFAQARTSLYKGMYLSPNVPLYY